MNLTFRDILGFNSNSQKLFSEKMPLTCAYKLSKIQKFSLVFMGINPCFVFSIGIKLRGLLERFL